MNRPVRGITLHAKQRQIMLRSRREQIKSKQSRKQMVATLIFTVGMVMYIGYHAIF